MTNIDFRHAPAAKIAEALHSEPDISTDQLQAALTNAMERIAALEKYRDEANQFLEAFTEQWQAAKLFGVGALNEQ